MLFENYLERYLAPVRVRSFLRLQARAIEYAEQHQMRRRRRARPQIRLQKQSTCAPVRFRASIPPAVSASLSPRYIKTARNEL